MTSISCRCGKVTLRLTSTSPRVSTECCCNSCFRRVQVLQQMGGPPVNPAKPIVNLKWDNRVVVEQGKDSLMAYRLSPKTKVYNIASSCCHTFLLGRNSEYDANCLTTNQDSPIYDDHYVEIPPSSRWFSNQWTQGQKERLDPLVGIWVSEDGNLTGEEGWGSVFEEHKRAMDAPIGPNAKGETFDELIGSLDPPKIVT